MKSFVITAIAMFLLISASSALAADLSWQEMAAHPDLWPKQVTVNVAMKFQGGASVAAGQKVNVERVEANQIDLSTTDGKLNFAADPNETDALAIAQAAYNQMTPKQRELNYAAVAKQRDLWPEKVTLTRPLRSAKGQVLRAGEQLLVFDVQPDRLRVVIPQLKITYDLPPQATDLLAQARVFVEDPKAPGRMPPPLVVAKNSDSAGAGGHPAEPVKQDSRPLLIRELDGKLLSAETGKPDPLDPAAPPKYFVFLRGSSTCGLTREFAPKLVEYYNQQIKAKRPDVAIVWLMCESPEDTGKFVSQLGVDWRAVTYEQTPYARTVNNAVDEAGHLPQLIVMDPNGKVLANGVRDQAPAALQRLDVVLKQKPQ